MTVRNVRRLFLGLFATTLLYAFIWPHLGSNPYKAKRTAAKLWISNLSKAVDAFYADVGRYPTTDEGFKALVECPANVPENLWRGPYLSNTPLDPPIGPHSQNDPWNHNYRYDLTPHRPHGLDYEIISAGADVQFGTKDDLFNYMDERALHK